MSWGKILGKGRYEIKKKDKDKSTIRQVKHFSQCGEKSDV